MSLEFILTSHAHLSGVRLSLRGQWGNVPFDNEERAENRAAVVANGRAYTVERKRFPALPTYRGKALP